MLERYGKSYKTSKWVERINERNCEYDALLNMCYNPDMQLDPQFLVLSSLLEEDLISIAQSYYHYNRNASIDSSAIQNIIKQLGILDPGLNRPLYLIFLIDAWIDNRDLSKWNKTFILESVLKRELHRIKVILKNVIDDDLLVNAYLNVLIYSTIMDGLKYPEDMKVICSDELVVFQESMEYHRKDIMKLFQQIGFLIEDNDGNLFFEGLKPDLLGEYYIFSNYIDSGMIKEIVQRSYVFPQKAYSFYNRLLDDYYYETDSDIRSLLVNADTGNMSGDQFFYFTEFLYERIVRDNRINSAKSLKRLSLLYVQNRTVENAVVYAYGLSSMMDEFNLKKTKKLLLELKNLYNEYENSIEIAIEYANSLVCVIERKFYDAAKKEFYNLKRLYEKSTLANNMEINLCYARALKILCFKEIDIYASWNLYKELRTVCQKNYGNSEFVFIHMQCLCGLETTPDNIGEVISELIDLCKHVLLYNHCISWEFYKELRTVFPKFCENKEFVFVYAQCLFSLKTVPDNVDGILSELLSLCDYKLARQVYIEYVADKFRKHILSKEEAAIWLNKADELDSNYYLNLIKEDSDKNITESNDSQTGKGDIHEMKSVLTADINSDIEKARKLVWLSNGLKYKQYKYLVGELKDLFEKHKDTELFLEYYLVGLITLSKHPNLIADDAYGVLENILKLSDMFLDSFNASYRISVFESILELVKYNSFSNDSILLLKSFALKNTEKFGSEKEAVILADILYQTKDLELGIDIEEYLESVLVDHCRSSYMQSQYVKFLSSRKFDLVFAIEKLIKFNKLQCSIISDFLVDRIKQLSANEESMAYIWNIQSKQKMEIFIGIYAELILRHFLEKPDKKYYMHLRIFYNEHKQNNEVVLNYAMLLFAAVIRGIIDINQLFSQFEKIEKNNLNQQTMNILVENYAETILKLYWVKSKQVYYHRLQDLENRYRGNRRVALYYAQLLYYAKSKNAVDSYELYNQFIELEKIYTDKKIIFLFQKTLSRFVSDSIKAKGFSKYINKQQKIYDMHGTLDIAMEYCHSLCEVSSFISEEENLKNYLEVKRIARYFPDSEFSEYSTIILDHSSRENIAKAELENLKIQIQHLYNYKSIYRVNVLVKRAREAFREFHSVDFAVQLCRMLSFLSELVTGKMLDDIIEEAEMLYDQYCDEFSIFKYYVRILQEAMQDNRTLAIEKINSIEKRLVQKIKEDKNFDDEICNNLLTVLKLKNNENRLMNLKTGNITIPKGYTANQPSSKEIDDILDYYHSQGVLSKPVGIIIIQNKYVLIDGYDRWYAASANNIKRITVKVWAEYE